MTVLELNGLPYISINLERIMRKMESPNMLPAFFLPFEDGTAPDDPLAGIFRQELGELMSEYRHLTAYIEGISDSWMRSVFEWRFVECRTFREIGVKCSMDAETLKQTVYSYIHRNPEGYVTCRDLADRWGVNVSTVNAYCRRGLFHGAVKGATGKLWLIPEGVQRPVYIPKRQQPSIPAGFVTAKECANAVGVKASWITAKCKRGDYPGARKIGRKQWIIPEKHASDHHKYQRPVAPTGFVTARDLAESVGVSARWIAVKCRKGDYPGARKFNPALWIIPEKYVNDRRNGKKQP